MRRKIIVHKYGTWINTNNIGNTRYTTIVHLFLWSRENNSGSIHGWQKLPAIQKKNPKTHWDYAPKPFSLLSSFNSLFLGLNSSTEKMVGKIRNVVLLRVMCESNTKFISLHPSGFIPPKKNGHHTIEFTDGMKSGNNPQKSVCLNVKWFFLYSIKSKIANSNISV